MTHFKTMYMWQSAKSISQISLPIMHRTWLEIGVNGIKCASFHGINGDGGNESSQSASITKNGLFLMYLQGLI